MKPLPSSAFLEFGDFTKTHVELLFRLRETVPEPQWNRCNAVLYGPVLELSKFNIRRPVLNALKNGIKPFA